MPKVYNCSKALRSPAQCVIILNSALCFYSHTQYLDCSYNFCASEFKFISELFFSLYVCRPVNDKYCLNSWVEQDINNYLSLALKELKTNLRRMKLNKVT